MTQTVPVSLQWISALPIRQAIAKSRFGDAALTAPEAVKLLGPQERYIVQISGLSQRFVRAEPADLKSHAFLKIKGREPIAAAAVQGTNQNGQVVLFLIFARQEGGKPVITLEDREVEVSLELGQSKISQKFRLKDMVFDGKLEI